MGYPAGWFEQNVGMPTPCFSKEPGAGIGNFAGEDAFNQDPRDWWGDAIGMRPLGHLYPCPTAQAKAAKLASAQLAPAAASRKRKFDLAAFPEALLRLPSALEMLDEIAGDEVMELDLPRPRDLAGAILAHACAAIARRIQPGGAVFKIGITTNPVHRWHNERYGYRLSSDGFETMVLLLATDCGAAAAYLEAALIKQFQQTRGCRNVASGGEGLRPTAGPFFTYLVINGRRV